jgi:hypothetical protein
MKRPAFTAYASSLEREPLDEASPVWRAVSSINVLVNSRVFEFAGGNLDVGKSGPRLPSNLIMRIGRHGMGLSKVTGLARIAVQKLAICKSSLY